MQLENKYFLTLTFYLAGMSFDFFLLLLFHWQKSQFCQFTAIPH